MTSSLAQALVTRGARSMRKFADIAHRKMSERSPPPPTGGRALSHAGALSARRMHRDLGNQAMQRLYSRAPSYRASRPQAMNDNAIMSTLRATVGSGEPLREPTKTFMKMSLGARFDQVRVHTDDWAGRMAQALDAEAFALGRNIY